MYAFSAMWFLLEVLMLIDLTKIRYTHLENALQCRIGMDKGMQSWLYLIRNQTHLIDVIFCQMLKDVAHVDVLLDGRPVDPHAALARQPLNLFPKKQSCKISLIVF